MKVFHPARDPHGDLPMGSIYEITEIIEDTVLRLGVKMDMIKWDWNTRLTGTMGYAECVEKRLAFSHPLWPNATPEQRKHTVVHEAVHLVAYAKHGRAILGRHHGYEWRSMMREVGEKPMRCHTVPRTGAVSTIVGHCDCKEHVITMARFRKHGSNGGLKCRTCNTQLIYEMNGIV